MSNASLGTNFSDIWINIQFVYKIMRFKISSAKWRPFRPGLNAWNHNYQWDAKLIQIKRAFDKSWKMPKAHRGCFCPVMLGLYVTRSGERDHNLLCGREPTEVKSRAQHKTAETPVHWQWGYYIMYMQSYTKLSKWLFELKKPWRRTWCHESVNIVFT